GRGRAARPCGATGMLFSNGTFCWPDPLTEKNKSTNGATTQTFLITASPLLWGQILIFSLGALGRDWDAKKSRSDPNDPSRKNPDRTSFPALISSGSHEVIMVFLQDVK